MPSVSFKKDELGLVKTLVSNHFKERQAQVDGYERKIAAGEATYYDEREFERLKDTLEWIARISVKMDRALHPSSYARAAS